jgi:hypothetical protein
MALSAFQWCAGKRCARAYAGKPARNTSPTVKALGNAALGGSWQLMAKGEA